MNEINVCLSVDELDALKLLVKERIAIWQVRINCATSTVVEEHCRFEYALYNSLLMSLNKSV